MMSYSECTKKPLTYVTQGFARKMTEEEISTKSRKT